MRGSIAILALLALASACGKETGGFRQDEIELTHVLVKKLAFEAFPQWAMAHVSKECPDAIDELLQYVNEPKAVDRWGHPLRMVCGTGLPAGVKGIAIHSLGPDGQDATADDVKSWD